MLYITENFHNEDSKKKLVLSDFFEDVRIAWYSFKGIEELELSEGIKSINQFSFAYNNLTEVIIPKSVELIDNSAFIGNPLETIYGYEGTIAKEFAEKQGVHFVSLGA